MRQLVKKLDASNRLAPALLARAPSFKVAAGALADGLHEVMLSNGEMVHLHLAPHTHLNPGDVLLDSMGMMVRIDAALQAVLAVAHSSAQALVALALSAHKQGRALGWEGSELLLAQDTALEHYLQHAGFELRHTQGKLNMLLAGLPSPEHGCGHDHGDHSHAHAHELHEPRGAQEAQGHEHQSAHAHSHDAPAHGHTGHVHGPDCKH